MKNNNHNAKHAQSKTTKPTLAKNTDKNQPKRVKNKTATKAKSKVEKSDVDFVKIAKSGLHEQNPHRGRYDFNKLTASEPRLKSFVIKNPKGEDSINFSDPKAVKMLNKALLAAHYNIEFWDIPDHYLCPPIPGFTFLPLSTHSFLFFLRYFASLALYLVFPSIQHTELPSPKQSWLTELRPSWRQWGRDEVR